MGRRKNQTKAVNKIITTRLIEISMRVDDYVYKHIPISEGEAARYMKEVSIYKVQCSRDQRSLQVIEKLTRCMKAIIRDHQEMRNGNCTNNDGPVEAGHDRSGTISPVYSIPDEDRNQLTQVTEENGGDNTEVTTDIEIVDLTNIEDEHNFNNDGTNTQTAKEYNVEVEIHRGLSNLSLQDFDHTLKDRIEDTNCSQSILNNFGSIENMQQNKITADTPESTVPINVDNICDINKTNNTFQTSEDVSLSKINSKASFIHSLNKSVTLNTCTVPKIPIIIRKTKDNFVAYAGVKTDNVKIVPPVNCNQIIVSDTRNGSLHSSKYSKSNVSESQKPTSQDPERTCTVNSSNQDSNIMRTPQNKVNKTNPTLEIIAQNFINPTNSHHEVSKSKHILKDDKTLKVVNNKKNTVNSIAIDHSAIISLDTKKRKIARKKKDTNINKITNKLQTKNAKDNKGIMPGVGKTKKVPIYNENVIDDLSWIENIRYVREIAADENDSKLQIEDDFWDNYYLPANWNDEEFA